MRLDAHSCALGKAMLAYKSFEELKEIYKSYTLHKHTENTITSLEKLYMQLRKVRSNGYSTNEAETFNYVYGVGAPILDKQNRAIAAISLSGTKSTINIKTIPILAEKITKTSERISLIISDN
jgi:DNA-binding IclR family transcriptional regulator